MANKWFIAIKERGEDIYDLSGLTILESPEGHYWADPFLVEHEGKTFLFFEDYDYIKGRLAVGELDGLELKNVRTILDAPWHMSFPSVVEFSGVHYMAPERVLSGSLWIYSCERFPDVWNQHRVVARGRFDDPIIKAVENGYQVWATEDNKLVVFEAPSLHHEEWKVVMRRDLPFMRSAGNFLGGNLRPTQDSVPVYGRAIKIMDGDNARRSIEPTWYPELTGTHTFNVSSKYVVIDGRIKLS
jgi:hypothetical protein